MFEHIWHNILWNEFKHKTTITEFRWVSSTRHYWQNIPLNYCAFGTVFAVCFYCIPHWFSWIHDFDLYLMKHFCESQNTLWWQQSVAQANAKRDNKEIPRINGKCEHNS